MSDQIVIAEVPAYQCRHIFTDGHRCGSRSLRRELFCYYHHQTRKPVTGPRHILNTDPHAVFDLPLPEDRSAIQQSIGLILQRIASNQLDPRRAGLLLYALQIASSNLPKAAKNTRPVETVDEIAFDQEHGYLAPESELHHPQGEKSLETILLEQWAKDDELAAEQDCTTPGRHQSHSPDIIQVEAVAETFPTGKTVPPCLGPTGAGSGSRIIQPATPTYPDPREPDFQAARNPLHTRNRKAHLAVGSLDLCRRSPNLPHTYACSTIGPTRLNFRVRDGNGCDPRGKLTGKLSNILALAIVHN